MLTRDPRVVEEKKPGQPKARKKFQWVRENDVNKKFLTLNRSRDKDWYFLFVQFSGRKNKRKIIGTILKFL